MPKDIKFKKTFRCPKDIQFQNTFRCPNIGRWAGPRGPGWAGGLPLPSLVKTIFLNLKFLGF